MESQNNIDPADAHVGARLRMARRLRGLSQSELGALENLTFQQVQKYERGANRISASRLYHFSKYLGVSAGWFFEGLEESAGQKKKAACLEAVPAEVLHQNEACELLRCYYRIKDERQRHALRDLFKTLQEPEAKT